jgi:hypothetical protein
MNRLKQPSTWAGVAIVLPVLKLMFPAWGAVVDGLVLAAGGAAVALNEKGPQ